jgi:hypothetical protein
MVKQEGADMATYHCQIKVGNKGSGACATAKADYVCREGKYAKKGDLEGTPWHGNMPTFAQDKPGDFWQAADSNERANGRVFTEIEIALPRDFYSAEERRKMVVGFIAEQLPGHPFTVAIHCPLAAIEGGEQPHAHIIFSERIMDGIERDRDQFFKRAAAPYRDRVTKEMKDGDPLKGGAKKDLSWHSRDKIIEVRETWERHHNKGAWAEDQVSCKSLKAQGIDREPEQHLGPGLARTAAADHVVGRRKDVERLKQVGRELVIAKLDQQTAAAEKLAAEKAAAESARLAAEKDAKSAKWFAEAHARIDKYKAAALAAQVQPTTVFSEIAAITAIAPQLRQEVVSAVPDSPAPSEAPLPLVLNENTPPPSEPAVQSVTVDSAPAPALTTAELAFHAVLRRIADFSRTFRALYKALTAGNLLGGEEAYNDRTDRLEAELKEIIKPYPGMKVYIPHEDGTPIRVNGEPITAIIDRLPAEQKQEKPLLTKPIPAPRQGPTR